MSISGRAARKLTHLHLAYQSGYFVATISNYETGLAAPHQSLFDANGCHAIKTLPPRRHPPFG
jgi:hypothetical protein